MNLDKEHVRSKSTGHHLPLINIGWGKDISIENLALVIKEIVGFEGNLIFDHTKLDGTPRKLADVSKLKNLGWSRKISLRQGTKQTYAWCIRNAIFA